MSNQVIMANDVHVIGEHTGYGESAVMLGIRTATDATGNLLPVSP